MGKTGGVKGLFISPSKRQEVGCYSGPRLADVEKTMQATKELSGERKELAYGICGAMVISWKRKVRDEPENNGEILSPPIYRGRKKKEISEIAGIEDGDVEPFQKSYEEGNQNGLGMAEAAEQPR
jgi:hypothetical protein